MFKIGEFSKLAKVTIKTLRFYDEINLFKPKKIGENNYRFYSIEDLETLQIIVKLRNLNVSIDEIRKILNGENFLDVLKNHKQKLIENLNKTKLNIVLMEKLITDCEKGRFMKNYQVEKKVLPECIVYYRHGVIKSMANIVEFILEAGEECRKNNPDLKCENYCFVTYSAKEYQEKNVELEYVEAVEKFGKESKNIKFKKLPKVNAITIAHKGCYAEMPEAYAFAINAVKEMGLEITGSIRECYIHGCWDCENEDDYLTEIQIPVK